MILRFLFIFLFSIQTFGATYYVSTEGDDADNGLGPDASDGTNRPWLTIGKALGASGISSGDTIYIGPGVYREVVTVAMTSAVAETFVLADPTNAQGFKDGSGNLLSSGEVRWTGYTTDDRTAPNASTVLNLSARDYLTFEGIDFVGSANNTTDIVQSTASTSTNITFRKCSFISGSGAGATFNISAPANTALNWLIENCTSLVTRDKSHIALLLTTHTADYDANFVVRNILFISGAIAVNVSNSASSGGAGAGVEAYNCTSIGPRFFIVSAAGTSQTYPCVAENNIIIGPGGSAALTSGHTSQLTENYNYITHGTARSNVSTGANSSSDRSIATMLEIGQWVGHSRLIKPMFTPTSGSYLLGFTNSASAPTTDFLRRPRPSGGGNTNYAVGALERHDFGAKETTVTDASGIALKLVGPGDHDIRVPVNATSTTLTIRVRYDTNHGTTSKPQAILLAAPEIGVSTETETAAGSADTWETLTFSSFTPTAKGWVTLRLVSRSETGNGIAYFDTLTQ